MYYVLDNFVVFYFNLYELIREDWLLNPARLPQELQFLFQNEVLSEVWKIGNELYYNPLPLEVNLRHLCEWSQYIDSPEILIVFIAGIGRFVCLREI